MNHSELATFEGHYTLGIYIGKDENSMVFTKKLWNFGDRKTLL